MVASLGWLWAAVQLQDLKHRLTDLEDCVACLTPRVPLPPPPPPVPDLR